MGAANVSAVFARWHSLPHRAFRVLTYMALVSMDDDRPPRYFGRREALANALGREADRQGLFAVRDAISELQRAGAIERVTQPGPGRRAEYLLRLVWTPAMVTAETSAHGYGSAVPMVTAQPSNSYGSAVPMVTAQPLPKENVGTTGTPEEASLEQDNLRSAVAIEARKALARRGSRNAHEFSQQLEETG